MNPIIFWDKYYIMSHNIRTINDNNCDIITKILKFPFVIRHSDSLYCNIGIKNIEYFKSFRTNLNLLLSKKNLKTDVIKKKVTIKNNNFYLEGILFKSESNPGIGKDLILFPEITYRFEDLNIDGTILMRKCIVTLDYLNNLSSVMGLLLN
jgi:hypothetical protein